MTISLTTVFTNNRTQVRISAQRDHPFQANDRSFQSERDRLFQNQRDRFCTFP